MPRFEKRGKKTYKQIVACANGYVKSTELVGILGPSGSGKTSLLNVLAQRNMLSDGSYWHGDVKVNNRRILKGEFGNTSAFVQQDDILEMTMTARELFRFACQIRIGLNGNEMDERVDSVINRLSLQSCADTIIGGLFRKGVSGGERKRISIGYELITNPSLLLLDEPTSGLDSSTSLRIVKLLKQESKRGMTILATVHQPSSELFFEFDRVILLSEGYTVYNDCPKKIANYFSPYGLNMSRFANPADKLIIIASAPLSLLNSQATIVQIASDTKDYYDSNLRGQISFPEQRNG